jgi:hypothetical protein
MIFSPSDKNRLSQEQLTNHGRQERTFGSIPAARNLLLQSEMQAVRISRKSDKNLWATLSKFTGAILFCREYSPEMPLKFLRMETALSRYKV